MEQGVGDNKLFPRGAPWSEKLSAATKEHSTDPDNTSRMNQDHLESGILPVLRLPVLHIEGQTSVAIQIVITMPQGTRGTHSHR